MIRGIKHDFPFINIRKVPREGFQPSRGALLMLMNDKIMFDRYYCINLKKKHFENEESIGALREYAMHDSGQGQVLII